MKPKSLATAMVAAALISASAAVFAPAAQAIPTYSIGCPQCHPADSAVTLIVKQIALGSSDATYSVEVSSTPGPSGWAVFGPSGKITYGLKATGQFTVPIGQTYTVFGVAHQTNHSGSVTISPAALAKLPLSRPVLSPVTPRHGHAFHASGTLGRPHPVAATVTFYIQKFIRGKYRTYSHIAGAIAANSSKYSGTIKVHSAGHYRIRVSHGDAYDLPSLSAWRTFRAT